MQTKSKKLVNKINLKTEFSQETLIFNLIKFILCIESSEHLLWLFKMIKNNIIFAIFAMSCDNNWLGW